MSSQSWQIFSRTSLLAEPWFRKNDHAVCPRNVCRQANTKTLANVSNIGTITLPLSIVVHTTRRRPSTTHSINITPAQQNPKSETTHPREFEPLGSDVFAHVLTGVSKRIQTTNLLYAQTYTQTTHMMNRVQHTRGAYNSRRSARTLVMQKYTAFVAGV